MFEGAVGGVILGAILLEVVEETRFLLEELPARFLDPGGFIEGVNVGLLVEVAGVAGLAA